MAQRKGHKAFLAFVSQITENAARYSKKDLAEFTRLIEEEYPALRELAVAYVRLAEESDTGVVYQSALASRSRGEGQRPHLFDLLRSKKLFPSNADLEDFAGRILPNIDRRRFGKMSRADIAARIIEHLEQLDKRTRRRLEDSMRRAVLPTERGSEVRESFFKQWERIIKGIEL